MVLGHGCRARRHPLPNVLILLWDIMCMYDYDRRTAAGLRTRVDVLIDGWLGKATVAPSHIKAFSVDLRASIPNVGFDPNYGGHRGQKVQLDKTLQDHVGCCKLLAQLAQAPPAQLAP